MGSQAETSERVSPRRNADLAIAGLVLGFAAAAIAFTSWPFLALPIASIGVVLACAGLVLPHRARRWAVAGLLVSLLAGVLATVPMIDFSGSVSENVAQVDRPVTSSLIADDDVTTISYEVLTDGLSVTHLSYVDFQEGSTVMRESLGMPPPFRHVVTVPKDEPIDLSDFSVTGMGGSSSFTVSCSVSVDGKVVSRNRASGAYGLVNCVGPDEVVSN